MNLRLKPEEQIADMRTVSENVATYLDNEEYKEDFSARDFTIEDILKRCYEILIDELQDFGITFNVPTETLLESWYTAKLIYSVRALVESKNLTDLFVNQNKTDEVEALINSDEFSNSDFDKFLEIIDDDRYQLLLDHASWIMISTRFVDHVSSIITNIHINESRTSDMDEIKNYINKVSNNRKILKGYIDLLLIEIDYLNKHVDRTHMKFLLDRYDQDKINPNEVSIYSRIDREVVPENLELFKKEMLDKHHLRAPHHIEYWTKKENTKPMSLEDFILLMIHSLGEETPFNERMKNVLDMVSEYKNYFDNLYIKDVTIPTQELISKIIKVVESNKGN